jgi:hypothetical protein
MAKANRSAKKPAKPIDVPKHIFILAESPDAGIQKLADAKEISVEKLREHLQSFTAAISSALGSVQTLAGEFQLDEVEVHATLSAEAGFVWITKAGLEGGISLKFTRKA